jgi:hypothetical protein
MERNSATPEWLRVALSAQFWRGPGPWIAFFMVALNVIIWSWDGVIPAKQQQNYMLNPTQVQALDPASGLFPDRGQVRYDLSSGNDLARYWPAIPDAVVQPLVVICGMSQMYTINEAKAGDEIIAEHLDDHLAPKGVRVFGLAAPNLCNEEGLLLLLSVLSDPHTKPKAFIYGVCFDKFRNLDIRPTLQSFMSAKPALVDAWKAAAADYTDHFPMATQKMRQSVADAGNRAKQEEGFEPWLRSRLADGVPMIAARQELSAQLQLQLYFLRNLVLDIKATDKRPVIQSRYELNWEFLKLMVELARRENVGLILYTIPLNPKAETPYVPSQYEEFKRELESYCNHERIPYANLENTVPHGLWGLFNGGPDFKHFKEAGHQMTAQALLDHFEPVLLQMAGVSRVR